MKDLIIAPCSSFNHQVRSHRWPPSRLSNLVNLKMLNQVLTLGRTYLTDCLLHSPARIDVLTQMLDFRLRPIDQE